MDRVKTTSVGKPFSSRIIEALSSNPPTSPEPEAGPQIDRINNDFDGNIWIGSDLDIRASSDAVTAFVKEIYDTICATALPGELARIEIKGCRGSIRIHTYAGDKVQQDASCEPITKLTLEHYTEWSGGLLNVLLPNLQSLEMLQWFPSQGQLGPEYPKLKYLMFHSPSHWVEVTRELENMLLGLLSKCLSIQTINFKYASLLSQPNSLPGSSHEMVELPSLKSFTQHFSHWDYEEIEPISFFNRLILPPQCNITLKEEDPDFKRPWDISFPILPHHLSQYKSIKTVEISVNFDGYKTTVVKATLLDPNRKVSFEKWIHRECCGLHPLFKQIMDFLEKNSVGLSVKTLELNLYLGKLDISSGDLCCVYAMVHHLKEKRVQGNPLSTVTTFIKYTDNRSSKVSEIRGI